MHGFRRNSAATSVVRPFSMAHQAAANRASELPARVLAVAVPPTRPPARNPARSCGCRRGPAQPCRRAWPAMTRVPSIVAGSWPHPPCESRSARIGRFGTASPRVDNPASHASQKSTWNKFAAWTVHCPDLSADHPFEGHGTCSKRRNEVQERLKSVSPNDGCLRNYRHRDAREVSREPKSLGSTGRKGCWF